MTRGRFSTCKCCGALAASAYCDGCVAHHTRRIAVAQAAIVAIWGTAGLARYQTEVRVQRLSGRHTGRQRSTRPARASD